MKNISLDTKYEIVVVGGGMVGATFAIALIKALGEDCPKILVVEAAETLTQKKYAPSFDARSTALSFGSRKILEETGIWSDLNKIVTPIDKIHISDKGRFGTTLLSSEEQNLDALGYVVENTDLGSILNYQLESALAIDFLSPAKIKEVRPKKNCMNLSIAYKDESYSIEASLVVLADGGRSPICQQLGIPQFQKYYKQHAIIANVSLERPHKNIAFERFTENGPFAMLPLENFRDQNRCAMVCVVDDHETKEIMRMTEEPLLLNLQERFGDRLGKMIHIGERYDFPLTLSIAKEQIRPGLVLLGNVAHTLHPVAGQGMNLALRDIRVLVDCLSQGIKRQINPGDMTLLQEFVDQQFSDHRKVIGFTDNLVELFSSNKVPNVILRKLGLLSLELFPALRKSFAKEAIGLATVEN
ncbi:MAG: 2-octaprenyl-6-methoxyphenyl hydroxylase [Gammaproteobacteria bacterium]|nr:2-octaprenyl-6-methoxyphenyl hydroxylase [Gammaproteobacteria bacterium]